MAKRHELQDDGKEYPDQTPVEWPLGLSRPMSLHDEIKMYIRAEYSKFAQDAGYESFEEADDFEVDDDEGELVSPYEMTDMQAEAPVAGLEPAVKREDGAPDAAVQQSPSPPAEQPSPEPGTVQSP